MVTGCPPCSRIGTERSNPQCEARQDKLMSRNASELDSASLRYVGVARLPKRLKPVAIGEATFISSQWAPRGGWRRRVRTEKSRNLRDPDAQHECVRESDVPIVAKKQGNVCGAKGDDCEYATVEI